MCQDPQKQILNIYILFKGTENVTFYLLITPWHFYSHYIENLKYSRNQMLLNRIKPTWIQKQYILRILAHVSEFHLSFKTVKCVVDWQVSSWSFTAVFEPYLHLYLVLTICDGIARDGF